MKQIEDFLSRELKNDEMIVINGGLSSEVTEGKGDGGFNKKICSMRSFDTSLNDYIIQDFRTKSLIKEYQNNI